MSGVGPGGVVAWTATVGLATLVVLIIKAVHFISFFMAGSRATGWAPTRDNRFLSHFFGQPLFHKQRFAGEGVFFRVIHQAGVG